MSKAPACVRPIVIKKGKEDPSRGGFVFMDYARAEHINQVKPYHVELEITSRCAGACAYCFASGTNENLTSLPTEKVLQLVDDFADLGVKVVSFASAEPLLHPGWAEISAYCAEKGMETYLCSSGMISKRDAKKITELFQGMGAINCIQIHIDSIVQEVYNRVHTEPSTMEKKMRGYKTLLEAGYPAERVMTLITLTHPIMESIEETMDWFVDEMGSKSICMPIFKTEGFAGQHKDWEPSLSEVRRAVEYRAKKLGPEWLRIGASDAGQMACRSLFGVHSDGDISPCLVVKELAVGNIHKESLKDIFAKHRDTLLFNFEISGACGGSCENSDICFGCRATAYHYLGDVTASDPKCYLNPEAKEYYFQ